MLLKKCLLFVVSVLVLVLSASCGKSELAKEVPPPSNVDACFLGVEAGQYAFGCAALNDASRPSYFLDIPTAEKQGMACMSFAHKQAMEEYDEKVARTIRWLRQELASCKAK